MASLPLRSQQTEPMVQQSPSQTKSSRKKSFSSFNTKAAYKQLGIEQLLPWQATIVPRSASDFFQERMARLQRNFDLKTCEDSKKLLIDAVCEEALEEFDKLKVWKGSNLETETTAGVADYLIAANKGYLETPYLCIVEAKKDDFEQGLAQCLVEMQACQWENQRDSHIIDVFGIVSNGEAWAFYKLTTTGEAYETPLYAISDLETVLGWLAYLLEQSQLNLQQKAN